MKSIYQRNFAVTAILVMSCFFFVISFFVGLGRMNIIKDSGANMMRSAEEVSHTASVISRNDGLSGWLMGMTISTVSGSTGDHIFITDPQGVVVSCCDGMYGCGHLGREVSPETVNSALQGGSYFVSDVDGMYPSPRYVVCKAISSMEESEIIGYVFVTCEVSRMVGDWSGFFLIAAIVAVVVLFLSLSVSLYFSKRMARPLDEIAAASRKFARGDFSVRVKQEYDQSDEVGALIDAFNKMADSLENAEAQLSEFIANISHELRTPMTTIAGFADGILDGTIPQEEAPKYLRSIRNETRRLSRLVRDMLDASQMKSRAADPSRRTVFDLTELVLQTLLSFESRATKKELDVDPQLPDTHIMVIADKDAITQVIYNLLDNAVKFASVGSCITLRLYKDGGKAYVSVSDVGETIPPDDLPFIFDRFHKSDRSRSLDKEGVGLGLYLVKSIINSHDEDIAVKSENGVTEFVFTLKLADK